MKYHSKETCQGDWGLFSNCVVSQLRADLCSRVGDSWSMFEFIQAISTRIPKIPCLSSNSMASRHLQTTMFLKSREVFDWILIGHHFQNFGFWGTKIFSKFFSPWFRSACGLGPRGRGSRGKTPLHYAALEGHEVVVERLLEAKAAVDAEDSHGRGLGRGFAWENLLRQWDLYVRKRVECWWFKFFRYFIFCGKCFAKTIWHWYFVLFFVIQTILCRHLELDSFWIDAFTLEIESGMSITIQSSGQVSWFELNFFHYICEFGRLHQFHHTCTVADCLFVASQARADFFELEYVRIYPSHVVYQHGWHGFNRMLKGNMCIYEPTRWTPQKISNPQCYNVP